MRQSIFKKDSLSLESQIDICKNHINGEEYKIYKDAGKSGKNLDRPSMIKLIEDIKHRRVNRVISYRIDRISRSVLDFNNLLLLFKKYDVEYVSATESLDTSTPMGKVMLQIIIALAEMERESIADRVKVSYEKRLSFYIFAGK